MANSNTTNIVPIELYTIANYLQKIMKKKYGNFNYNRGMYFYGEDARNALLRFEYFNYVSSFDYVKKIKNPDHHFLPDIESFEDADRILSELLKYNLIQAVNVDEKEKRPIITAKPDGNNKFELDQYYMWNYLNDIELLLKLGLITSVILLLCIIHAILVTNDNLSIHGLVLILVKIIIFLFGIGGLFLLVRFIILEVTKKKWNGVGILILPDLFADCSFKERFIPLYQYTEAKL